MNQHLESIPPSLIRELNAKKRPDSIDFGLGEPLLRPDLAPFEAAMRWVAEKGCPYTPNAGFNELREAIAKHYRLPGLEGLANICVTNGSQEALFLAIKALLDPNEDEVLIVTPSYPLYPKLCQMEQISFRTVDLPAETGFAPDAAQVLAAVGPQTRMIILGSPSNPTGRIWPEDQLRALANGLEAAAKPVWVLSDEVYRELYFGDVAPACIAQFHPYSLVANSLSKSNALTGLRLGWLMAPNSCMGAIIKVHQFVNTAASTFSQQVALSLFSTQGALEAHRPHYAAQREHVLAAAKTHDLVVVSPEGGFYCLLKIPGKATDSIPMAHHLIDEANVVTIPGKAFGDSAEGWLRLSFLAEPERMATGIGRIAEVLNGVR